MKSFILFTVSVLLLGLLLVPFNNNNNEGVAVVRALDVKRILHQPMSISSQEHQQEHQQQHEKHAQHEKHEQHIRHSKKAPGWEKVLKKDSKSKSKSKSKSTKSKSVKSKSNKSKSTKSKSTTDDPTNTPTNKPTDSPTHVPTNTPTNVPTNTPTNSPTNTPTNKPTDSPTPVPTNVPTDAPTNTPTNAPTDSPTDSPTHVPTNTPTDAPTKEEQSIAEIICDLDNADVFEVLCDTLRATGLFPLFDDNNPNSIRYTLFAPNNVALGGGGGGHGICSGSGCDYLKEILETHVLVPEIRTDALGCNARYKMVNGLPTTTKCGDSTEQKFQIGDGNEQPYPQIVQSNSNIQATNGIIHEIDGVIFPIIQQ